MEEILARRENAGMGGGSMCDAETDLNELSRLCRKLRVRSRVEELEKIEKKKSLEHSKNAEHS